MRLHVDVKISDLLDRLVLMPRRPEERSLIRVKLLEKNPKLRINQSAEGLCINACEVYNIDLSEMDLDLHWTELSENFVRNRQLYRSTSGEIVARIKQIREGGKEVAKINLQGFDELDVLDDHQWVNVACMTLENSYGLCLFDEQGAGKTVTLIYAYDVLVERDEVDFALIIAPKSMISEWPMDFKRFMDDRYKVEILTGSKTEKRTILSAKSDVLVTNFETITSMEQEIKAKLRKYGRRAIIVVDESFFAKNLDAKRTQAIRRLREYCGRAFVLCGTPAPNSPVDLVQQFNIVDFGFTFGDTNLPKDRQEAAHMVQSIIDEKGPFVRHLKADVLPGLPEKKFNRVVIPMQPKQSELYRQTSENLINELEAIDESTFAKEKMSFLAKRSALLQICSNPKSIDSSYKEIPSKLLAIDSLLQNLIDEKKEKVILWAFYTASIESMVKRYQKYSPVRYDGSITDTTARREAVRLFKEDEKTMLFIGNPAAAGAGLNLQTARYAIYESMSNQAAHYLQSLDRIHRRGQSGNVEYFILLCEGTLEISEYENLIGKEKSAQDILGDTISQPLTREMLLADLMANMSNNGRA